MAPFKSSLARSAGKLFGVFKEADLSLRGDVQSSRQIVLNSKVTASGGNLTDAAARDNGGDKKLKQRVVKIPCLADLVLHILAILNLNLV